MANNTKKIVQTMEPMGKGFNYKQLQRDLGQTPLKRLCLNENPYGPTPKIMDALNRYTREEAAYYPDPYQSELRQLVSQYYGKDEDTIVFTNGLDEMIQLLPRTFVEAGDEVLAHLPCFYEYKEQAEVDGAHFIGIQSLENGQVDWKEMKKAVSDKTKMVYICTPNNPTGLTETRSDIIDFLEVVPAQTVVLIDEAYIEFLEDPESKTALPLMEDYPQLAVMRTFSKAYGLANIRLGYTFFSKENARALNATRTPFNISGIKEQMAIEALKDQVYLKEVIDKITNERNKWLNLLDKLEIEYYPSQTNFILFHLNDAEKFIELALEKGYQIATHNSPEWIRMSLPKEEEGEVLRKLFVEFIENQSQSKE